MKMRMKTKRAGTTDAPIIQVGNGCLSPKGLMNQLLLSGDVTEKPEGTLSFCKQSKVIIMLVQSELNISLLFNLLHQITLMQPLIFRIPLNIKQEVT